MKSETDISEWRELLREGALGEAMLSFNELMQEYDHETDVEIGQDTYEKFEIEGIQPEELHINIPEDPETFREEVTHPSFMFAGKEEAGEINLDEAVNILVEFGDIYEDTIDLNLQYSNLDVKLPAKSSFWESKVQEKLNLLSEKDNMDELPSFLRIEKDFEGYLDDLDVEINSDVQEYKNEIRSEVGSGRNPKAAIAAVERAWSGEKYRSLEERFDIGQSAISDAMESMELVEQENTCRGKYIDTGNGYRIDRKKINSDNISSNIKQEIYDNIAQEIIQETEKTDNRELEKLDIIRKIESNEKLPDHESDAEKIQIVQDMAEEFTSAFDQISQRNEQKYILLPAAENTRERTYRMHRPKEGNSFGLKDLAGDLHSEFETVLSREEVSDIYHQMQVRAAEYGKIDFGEAYDLAAERLKE